MKTILELDRDDIVETIASYYGIKKEQVELQLYIKTTGYGMSERDEPDVRVVIEK